MELQLLLKIKKPHFTFYIQGKSFLLSVLFVVLSFSIFAQSGTPVINSLATRFDSLAKNNAHELVYIQTSKGIYEANEDLWFKAYVLDSHFFTPSPLSKTLYLQMVNEETEAPVWQEKYEIRNGFADGHVFLRDTLSEGDYLLEAFTAHSFCSDSSEFKAIRKITVKKKTKPSPSFTADFDKIRYNPGDTINLAISARSGNNEPLYAEVEATLLGGNKKLGEAQEVTNRNGNAKIAFVLQGPGKGLCVAACIKYTDKEKTLRFPVPHKKGSPVQFNTFPEGGALVAGIESILAFKAVNINGNPLEVNGTLYENDRPLLKFKSVNAGMGRFNFTPEAGKNYHIRLSEPATDSIFVLPEILPKGITFQLNGRDKEYLEFIVSQSPGMPKGTVYLRGQMRGMVCCMAGGKLTRRLKIKIPLKEFPQQGIAEFTLFNENLSPVAERLVYVHPKRKLYIKVKLDKEKYEIREKATLKIKVTDETGQPVQTNLGVSVFDKLYQNLHDPKNILTHCYLSEQLKGKIYAPAYYFDEKNKNRGEALDLLLLTQGWRRYRWSEENLKTSTSGKQPVIFDWTEGKVKATRKQKKAQAEQQLVVAFNTGKNEIKDFIVADSSGKFTVSPVHLKIWRGGYIYLKPMMPEDFDSRISLDNPFQTINNILESKKYIYPLPNQIHAEKEEPVRPYVVAPNVIELGEITVKGRGIKPFRDKYMGQLDSLTKIDLTSVWVCCHGYLENYLSGYSHECGNCGDSSRSKPVEGKTYRAIKYEYVGRQDGKKIVTGLKENIVWHYPKFTEEELLRMNNLYRVKAYYGEREFYQPNYDKKTDNDFLSDTRNTLLWAPSVITDEEGNARLEFFCSDINTGFIGNVEGVSGDGLLGTKDFEFKVLKTKPFKWEEKE